MQLTDISTGIDKAVTFRNSSQKQMFLCNLKSSGLETAQQLGEEVFRHLAFPIDCAENQRSQTHTTEIKQQNHQKEKPR